MADTKLTALTEVSAPALTDIIYLVADPAGTPVSDKITLSRLGGLIDPLYTTGRLTLATGNAVPITDQLAKGTLYYTAASNNGTVTSNPFQIVIYDGTRLRLYSSAEISLALTITSGSNYDVFIYDNAGTLTLELSAAWTNNTTRATALAAQSGTVVKSGTTTRRWVGTIRASGTNLTADSGGGFTTQVGGTRYVYNAYNQVPRMIAAADSTASWSYTTATVRQANAAAGNKFELVLGEAKSIVVARASVIVQVNSNSATGASIGIGLDTITNYTGSSEGLTAEISAGYNQSATGSQYGLIAALSGTPGLGYHYYAWLESGGDGTSLFLAGLGVAGVFATVAM